MHAGGTFVERVGAVTRKINYGEIFRKSGHACPKMSRTEKQIKIRTRTLT